MTDFIIFFIVEIKPDIAFAISIISRFTKNSNHQYTKAVTTILQYLKGSKKWEITYDSQIELLVQEYLDFN